MSQQSIQKYLQTLNPKWVINDSAFAKIKIANDWYTNVQLPFHKRSTTNGVDYELERTNFTKRLCSDDANLCETIEIKAQESKANNDIILNVLKENNFDVMYRKQLEKTSATGTTGCYLRVEDAELYENGEVKNGNLKINYADASNIVILTCINDEIIECGFMGESYDVEGSQEAVVVFKLEESGKYNCITAYFDKDGKKIKEDSITLGEVKPFAIMRVAEVNNFSDMLGYGLPKIFNVVAELKILDLTYNMWLRDLDKSDKMVILNKELCKYNETTGKYELPNDEMKKIFVSLGEDNDAESPLYQEYNPIIRIDDVEKSLELVLSMLSLRFGFGTKKYKFEEGRIVTATEYIGERQDAMQELNKQRQENKQYIEDIVKFIRWFEDAFKGVKLPNDEIEVTFDDSYVVDEEKKLEDMKNDAITFDIDELKAMYLKDRYNIDIEEARKWLDSASQTFEGDEE